MVLADVPRESLGEGYVRALQLAYKSKTIPKVKALKTITSCNVTRILTVWITANWKILKEMGIPDHFTSLLRNLYADKEATVKMGHETTDWFKIGKGEHQGCILSPCLFLCRVYHAKCRAG